MKRRIKIKHTEKRKVLQALETDDSFSESRYYEMLEEIGDIKYNYGDYLIREPIDCNKELERLPEADYDLCCALLTMLLQEDHFCNVAFERRYKARKVQLILERMIALLPDRE